MQTDTRVLGGVVLSPRRSTWLAVVLACVVLLTLLGHKPLANWDEAIYAEVSREMLSSGWLVPHWNGQVWLEKPPLILWITAVFFKLFGVTEFWARAGSALSGVAIVALLHGWLLRQKSRMEAWLCTLVLLSTFGFLHVCRVGEMDVLLSLGCCVALVGLTAVGENQPGGWHLFWTGFAIAAMTKGGAGIVLPVTAVALATLDRWTRRCFGKQFWLGLLLFLTLVLPWHLLVMYRFPRQFSQEYLGYHLLARATRPLEGHVTHWWFYLWVIFVSAMPWVLLYPFALYSALRRKKLRAWAVFTLVVLGFFSLIQTRLPHYIAPAYPALDLLSAAFLGPPLERLFSARHRAPGWMMWAFFVFATSMAGIILTSRARGRLHRPRDTTGQTTAGDKESVLLLQGFFRTPRIVQEPVLIWRQAQASSIATAVFYSKHRVQQVRLSLVEAPLIRDRYIDDPVILEQAVRTGPYLLLIDKPLVRQIPPALRYRATESGATMELGWIERR